ncbi:MAG: DeoR/GlpR transcriptional regulator [Rhizobiaceae bacterium]|nr:DeoR/GlpR transcriptional regulator [Rhizobiaceae bacterium]
MTKNERHALIVHDLEREPALRVNEMAKRYDVSSETIRRDLAELTERGLINRTYGGAVRVISSEPALSEREHINVAERQTIARLAVGIVEPDDVLMIGGGITTRFFAQALALYREPLTVITPSFHVAIALGACANIRIHVLPGALNGAEGQIEGAETVEALRRFRATRAFVGASGLTVEGPSDAAIQAGQIYQVMTERAMQSYVLADSSKVGQEALYCYSSWKPNMVLVTETPPPRAFSDALGSAGAEIVFPDRPDA